MKNRNVEDLRTSVEIQIPGGNKQIEHLLGEHKLEGKRALVLGNINHTTFSKLLGSFEQLNIIVEDYASLIKLRFNFKENESLKIKMMDYAHTDFENELFELVYAQGSISVPERKNMVKEMKRISVDGGLFSIGEIISLKEPVAAFIEDIWEQSGLKPLSDSSITKFYDGKNFEIISEKDLSHTLKNFYEKVGDIVSKMSKEEKEQDKKYFSRMKHESNAYLKLGGDKYIGFKSLIMRKPN
jgi:hypothetical protein